MVILDGNKLQKQIFNELHNKFKSLLSTYRPPRLDVILVAEDLASLKYVEMKKKAGESLGCIVNIHEFTSNVSFNELQTLIRGWNLMDDVDGIMIQFPLPSDLDEVKLASLIDPLKDVDGLNPLNLGKLFAKQKDVIIPATPLGILMLLNQYKVEIVGKRVVIVNDSNLIGMPLLALLTQAGGTVTICHDRTEDLESITKKADILISATGIPGLITLGHVKTGATVIDVGVSFDLNGKIQGDVVRNVSEKASMLTPVPGGVGPMTIAALLSNLFEVWSKRRY